MIWYIVLNIYLFILIGLTICIIHIVNKTIKSIMKTKEILDRIQKELNIENEEEG